jgi:uncharacterized protein with HEPN domain
MNEKITARLLRAGLDELRQARDHLTFSAQRVGQLGGERSDWSEADLEKIEAYTGRFARVVDLLTNKVLRALFVHELERAETVLDRFNLAEKRGFVASAGELRTLKEHRNSIAHDYAGTKMETIVAFCRTTQVQLDAICDRVSKYIESLLSQET